MPTIAQRVADLTITVSGRPLPIRIRAWDGSEAGPPRGPVLILRSRRALRRLLWAPSELGLAEAYIAGDVDIDGDLAAGLSAAWAAARQGNVGIPQLRVRDWPRLAVSAGRLRVAGRRPPPPGMPATVSERRPRRGRARAATAHHADLGSDFYELLLDESMAYSCGYFTTGPTGTLADAQRAKLDLICHKMGLLEDRRHLDVGCGWGSLLLHAAEHYGTVSIGITRSRRQYEYVSKRIADAGLGGRAQVRLLGYRDLADGEYDGAFDAVSAIEMGEHVGGDGYPAFADVLHRVLRPGGRALIQQMSQAAVAPPGGAFLQTYIAPDMPIMPLGSTVSLLGDAGLEVRDVHVLREHYGWTVAAWARTLEEHWDDVVAMIGEVGARTWRLYLVGGGLAFAANWMGVDQILAVRPAPDGTALMEPSRKVWE